MAGKVAESGATATQVRDIVCEVDAIAPAAKVRPLRVMLSGTVLVDFEITVTGRGGIERHVLVRVEFPDETRAMLETSTWTRGTSIPEAISRLGAAYLERNGVTTGLIGANDVDAPVATRPAIYHLPLSFVRSRLATVCAAAT
jgi:hypothetical protein